MVIEMENMKDRVVKRDRELDYENKIKEMICKTYHQFPHQISTYLQREKLR